MAGTQKKIVREEGKREVFGEVDELVHFGKADSKRMRKLLERFERYLRSVAKNYFEVVRCVLKTPSITFEDMEQIAKVAFFNAVKRYDKNLGPFIPYMERRVRAELGRVVRNVLEKVAREMELFDQV